MAHTTTRRNSWTLKAASVGTAAVMGASLALGSAPAQADPVSDAVSQLAGTLGVSPAALNSAGVTDPIASVFDRIVETEGLGVALGWLGIQVPDVINDLLGFTIIGDGVTISTVGPIPSLLKFLGGNSLWIAGNSGSIVDAVNDTSPDGATLQGPLTIKFCGFGSCFPVTVNGDLTLDGFALPVILGMGLGALDVTNAYAALAEAAASWDDGTIVIAPLIYVRNPTRPNGGILARFAPLLTPFGIPAVTPALEPAGRPGVPGQNGTGSVLIPIQIDVGFEYDAVNDFPSWPNPFSLANTTVAALPTYLFRNNNLDELGPIVAGAVGGGILDFFDLSINPLRDADRYVTLRSENLPLLEPLRLPLDVVNLLLGTQLTNPLADALEPALRILVNLGYTDVDQANGYLRKHDDSATPTSFMTMPANIDWAKVLPDVVAALGTGFQSAFVGGGIPRWNTTEQPNAIKTLLDMLGIDVPNLNDLLGNPLGIQPPPTTPASAAGASQIVPSLAGLSLGAPDLTAGAPDGDEPEAEAADLGEIGMPDQPAPIVSGGANDSEPEVIGEETETSSELADPETAQAGGQGETTAESGDAELVAG